MDRAVAELLDEVHALGAAHDAGQADRLARLRNVEPATGSLLNVLVRAAQPRSILEIGTSNGYSTLWLAEAAEDVDSTVISVELDATRTEMARENLERARLAHRVDLRTGDAGALLAEGEPGTFGFIFLDAERDAYPDYWPDLVRMLTPAGLLAADNAISHEAEMASFAAMVAEDPHVASALDATGAGVLIAVKAGESRPLSGA